MSDPITLYRLDVYDEHGAKRVGTFEERAWCATHDATLHPLAEYCWEKWAEQLIERANPVTDPCQPEPRLVQRAVTEDSE